MNESESEQDSQSQPLKDSLKELRIKRGTIKGRLTVFKNYVSEIKNLRKVSVQQIKELQLRLEKIDVLFKDYDQIQLQIEIKESISAGTSDTISSERNSTESIFYEAISQAQEIIDNHEPTSQNRINDCQESSNSPCCSNNIKLPTITLPSFDGNFCRWLEFRDSFVSLIHKNDSLSDINKFQYLKGSLTGIAKSVIESLELSAQNYAIAWKLVCDRFNNTNQLRNIHYKSLFDIETMNKESVKSLRYLADHIPKHLRALNSLGESTDNWDSLIIYLFSCKLDSVTCTKWEEYKNNLSKKPTLEQFYEFLRNKAAILEMTSASNSNKSISTANSNKQPYKSIDNQQKAFVAAACDSKSQKCLICDGDHFIYFCDKFKSMTVEDRNSIVSKLKLCINCLRRDHFAKQCKSYGCKICQRKHNTLLHKSVTNVKSIDDNKSTATHSASLSSCISNQVLLSTAIVNVVIDSKSKQKVRCLLDCGSQSSFISRSLKEKLAIEAQKVDTVCVTGINNICFNALERCSFMIKSCTNSFSKQVNAIVVSQVTSNLPSQEIDTTEINIPKNITLADPYYNHPAQVDLLLGADLFWEVICPEKINIGINKPILQNSYFGWLVVGPVMCNTVLSKENVYCNFSQEIRNQLKMFWELEELPERDTWSAEEQACEEHFVKHTRRLEDGRFCVTLPLREPPSKLGDSYYISKKRFDSLEKRFKRQPDVKEQYVEFINQYKELGHLSESERPEIANFLPHHPILREESESTKCRVVFDASAKTRSGFSLNDILMVGPTIQDDIFSILIRFRQHEFILTGDIEKMYRQIMVDESQRNLQMILWRENERECMRYLQLNTVTYGTSCAPFLSTRCLLQLAQECDDELIRNILSRDFYVDDLITGYDDDVQLKSNYQQIIALLSSAEFNLRKIKSNSKLLIKELTKNSCSKQENLLISNVTHTLGIEWNPNTDTIYMPTNKASYVKENKCTKRSILSVTCSIFDPLGLLCVCTVSCKILLQSLWLQKLSWDEEIQLTDKEKWNKFMQNINLLQNVKIPRHTICKNCIYIELHAFSDASLKAYASCIYVRSRDSLGHYTVQLLCAKTKVAPLKATTIPKLELCGALLAARLCSKVTKSIQSKIKAKKYYWCDSKIVLGWLKMPTHKLQTFVAHRVSEIADLTIDSEWNYVQSAQNPADLASRGCLPEEIQSLSLWWTGPGFLMQDSDEWPKQNISNEDLPEIWSHTVCIDNLKRETINISKFSSFSKLRNVFAYVLRFINNCRNKNKKCKNSLSVEEIEKAELSLARFAQSESFIDLNSKEMLMKSTLSNLNPFIDGEGVIRVGGRIENSNYTYNKKHPIVLASDHHFTILLFEYYHTKLMHAGPQLLLSIIREKYWPVSGRTLARKTYNKCMRCRRLKGAVAQQIMGNLPAQRIVPGYPFEVTGTDFAGPFLIATKKGRGARLIKAYLCVFICFKVKAVHLELVSDLSTESFILSLRRFISRRGKPREIFCDNGTNFVGASRELGRFLESCSSSISDSFVDDGIKFKFSPAYSPNFGGLYEAAVKSAKYHMRRVLGNLHCTFEELTTLFCQIEAILNSRPLCPMSSNPSDLAPLTPGHFIIGRTLTSLPSPDLQDLNPNHLHRYAKIEQARQHFWSRWCQEYICEMQQRNKWQKRQVDLQPGQLVLIKEETTSPLNWPLGRIEKVHPGSDGASRVFDVKTCKGILRRAVNRICPLLHDHAE